MPIRTLKKPNRSLSASSFGASKLKRSEIGVSQMVQILECLEQRHQQMKQQLGKAIYQRSIASISENKKIFKKGSMIDEHIM